MCIRDRLYTHHSIYLLFAVCWLSYFSAYLGRLNFTACIAAINEAENLSKLELGRVSSAFFVCYGGAQLFSGLLADRLRPKMCIRDRACRVLKTGMPLFLEKPVCISREQYEALREAGRGQEKRVVVSFPLRFSTITLEMEKLARSGSLGRLTMVQAVNNVPYGSVYYHSWYRDPAQTGGLFLQKATHDVDYLCSVSYTHLSERRP